MNENMMPKRIEIVKKIDKILTTILSSGHELLELADSIEDKDLKCKLLECVVILSAEGIDVSKFLTANIAGYVNKDIIDIEFMKLMKQLEDKNGK